MKLANAVRRSAVRNAVERSPICAVVRTETAEEALRQARLFVRGGLEIIEVTWSVPGALEVVGELLGEREGDGPPYIGMGTVTTRARAEATAGVGSEFIVSPNTHAGVAEVAKSHDLYLVMGALSATEIVNAWELGADLIKVYPLPPVGGPGYLSVVRQPLGDLDVPMLAGGGFDIEDVPAYRDAGARAFGIGGPLLGATEDESLSRIRRALSLARGAVSEVSAR